jgi:hypothetical protein
MLIHIEILDERVAAEVVVIKVAAEVVVIKVVVEVVVIKVVVEVVVIKVVVIKVVAEDDLNLNLHPSSLLEFLQVVEKFHQFPSFQLKVEALYLKLQLKSVQLNVLSFDLSCFDLSCNNMNFVHITENNKLEIILLMKICLR